METEPGAKIAKLQGKPLPRIYTHRHFTLFYNNDQIIEVRGWWAVSLTKVTMHHAACKVDMEPSTPWPIYAGAPLNLSYTVQWFPTSNEFKAPDLLRKCCGSVLQVSCNLIRRGKLSICKQWHAKSVVVNKLQRIRICNPVPQSKVGEHWSQFESRSPLFHTGSPFVGLQSNYGWAWFELHHEQDPSRRFGGSGSTTSTHMFPRQTSSQQRTQSFRLRLKVF